MSRVVSGRERAAFLAELIASGLFVPTGIDGVYGRGGRFEEVRMAIEHLITRSSINVDPELMTFPPLLPKAQLERIGYLSSFPHLAGTIFSFDGDEADALELERRVADREDWGELQSQTSLALVPAACYPVYSAVAARGPLPAGGVTVDLGGSYVFRNEPSQDPARLQMFHQREMVRLGDPDQVLEWRDAWSRAAVEILGRLGLDAHAEIASDPFFGRSGRMLARSQRSQALKLEVLLSITVDEPTAVASFNAHREHFSSVFDLRLPDGERAHTACVGFGLERITLALLSKFGLDVDKWPSDTANALWPGRVG